MNNRENLLIIFTRNIEFGKCKTRLAKTVGPEIYQFLVNHTAAISSALECDKWVFYSEFPQKGDDFDDHQFNKYAQQGEDLGDRMKNAFELGFSEGYKNIIIIGSDIYDLSTQDLIIAYDLLQQHDCVIGPADDGGYYLLGLNSMKEAIFENKPWGTATVFKNTLADLSSENVGLLEVRNDVDVYADIENNPVFEKFLKNWKK